MPLTIVFKHTIFILCFRVVLILGWHFFILSLFVPFIAMHNDNKVFQSSQVFLDSSHSVSVPFPLVSLPVTLCFSVPNGCTTDCATALIDFPSSLNRQLSGFLVGSTSS